jgi:RNA polymerase sigma-70 factor (ECF subfamily)
MGLSSSFATTRWSLVEAACSDDADARRRALGEFARRYRMPCEEWLRRKGCRSEQAEEIVQNFIVEVVLHRGLLGTAERGQGALRRLVLHALRNHATDLARRGAARGRHEALAAEGLLSAAAGEGANDFDPAFDTPWARAQLQEAVERVRRRSMGGRHEPAWRAFEQRVLMPAVYGTREPTQEEVARSVGLVDAARASVLVREMRVRVLRALEEVVSETARNPADLEAELAHVRACLGGRGE